MRVSFTNVESAAAEVRAAAARAAAPPRARAVLRGAAAAAEPVRAQGYEAATMTAIAARAGASIGSLYQYFPTK